jgi:hypothetical protein
MSPHYALNCAGIMFKMESKRVECHEAFITQGIKLITKTPLKIPSPLRESVRVREKINLFLAPSNNLDCRIISVNHFFTKGKTYVIRKPEKGVC